MRFSIFLSTFILTLLSFSCKDSTTMSGTTEDHELIANGSFEHHGNPSLDGWHQSYSDTNFVLFSTDTPLNGGHYSVSLLNNWGTPELQSFVAAPKGIYRYHLSVWSKSLPPVGWVGAMGVIRIDHQTTDSLIHWKLLFFSDSLWTQYTLLDTINCDQGDTLIISISPGSGQWNWGRTLFDNVSFLKLD
jgi:hypothetical protein